MIARRRREQRPAPLSRAPFRRAGQDVTTSPACCPFGQTEMDIEASARAGNTLYWMGSLSNSHHGELSPQTRRRVRGHDHGLRREHRTHLPRQLHAPARGHRRMGQSQRQPARPVCVDRRRRAVRPADGLQRRGPRVRCRLRRRSVRRLPRAARADGQTAQQGARDPGEELRRPGQARQPRPHQSDVRDRRWNGTSAASRSARSARNAARRIPDHRGPVRRVEHELTPSTAGTATPKTNRSCSKHRSPAWSPKAPGRASSRCPNRSPTATKSNSSRTTATPTWYESQLTSKNGLTEGLQKDLGRLFTIEIPAPAPSGRPHLQSGTNPNAGKFTIRWKPSPTLRARFLLQHQNAKGGWITVASNLSNREFTFNPETEGTWNYQGQGEQRNGRSRILGRIGSHQGRPHAAGNADRERLEAHPTTRAAAAGTKTASRSPSPRTATRRSPTAAPRAASNRRL